MNPGVCALRFPDQLHRINHLDIATRVIITGAYQPLHSLLA
jgi:hypothetical protein